MPKRRGLEDPGYGPNPADQVAVDESGIRYRPLPDKRSSAMSKAAMKGKDKVLERFGKESARQKALTKLLAQIKKTGKIPPSPTN
mgnify:CR=1 FL=1|jgi:hypothetical protein